MNSPVLITRSEYARRRGCAKSAVTKAVNEGRISTINGLIDEDVANIQWERNTRARADSMRGAASSSPAPAPGPAAVIADAPTPPGAAAQDPAEPEKPDTGYSFDRARREKFEADMAEMKLLEQQGQLVRVVEVRAEISKRIGQVRTSLLQIPARLAPLLANEADQAKCHALLDAELRTVLSSVSAGDHGRL